MYLYGILTHRVWLLNSCRTRSRSLRRVETQATTSHRSRLYTWKVRVLVAGRGRWCYCYCRSSCSLLDMTVTVFVAFLVSLFLSRTFVWTTVCVSTFACATLCLVSFHEICCHYSTDTLVIKWKDLDDVDATPRTRERWKSIAACDTRENGEAERTKQN